MLRRTLAAAVVVAATAAGPAVPTAHAEHHTSRCEFDALHDQDVTGENFEGVAYGVVVGDADDALAISCVVRVDGADADRTPPGVGTGLAYTAGRVVFTATATDIQFCALVTVDGATTETCESSTVVEVPPREVWDIYYWLLYGHWSVCDVLMWQPGTYGPLVVTTQGDVYVAGEHVWDCPPYEAWPGT